MSAGRPTNGRVQRGVSACTTNTGTRNASARGRRRKGDFMARILAAARCDPGSRIAILSKNGAHWLMADFAIWLAGHVSVPLYPTLAAGTIRQILEHSEARLLFVGKLDGWDAMKEGIPATLPCIATPLAPRTDHPGWE